MKMKNRPGWILITITICCLAVVILGVLIDQQLLVRIGAITAAVSLTLGLGYFPALHGYRYTGWIITAVVAGMMFPSAFTHWGNIDLRNKWLILIIIQLVMFGMGIQMSLRDFSGLGQTGKGVAIGLLCHFTIMPLMGLLLTRVFKFEPEIAAGIILIGSCSSGLASNVMVYLARANLVLSVIVTAMATMAAPFLTPLLMKLLAGTLIKVNVLDMMIEIIKIVIVPISAALLHDYLKTARSKTRNTIYIIATVSALYLLALAIGLGSFYHSQIDSAPLLKSMEIFAFLLAAIVCGVVYHLISKKFPSTDSIMPYFSMFGIIYFTTVTTAAGHDNLLRVGFLLFISSVIHNGAGYFFGYWLSRLFKLDKNSARTVAFEVGLQNGGMASGLAGAMGKLGTVGLPAAVFSPWMNISGSILANYWRKRPVDDNKEFEVKDHSKKPLEDSVIV